MNTKLETEAKNEFEKDFFKIMNNTGFGKSMENVRKHTDIKLVKHTDIKLVATNKRRSYLVWEPNDHTAKCFSENLLAIETKMIKLKMKKPVYLSLLVLEIGKTLMYGFWCDYIKLKYQDNAKLC